MRLGPAPIAVGYQIRPTSSLLLAQQLLEKFEHPVRKEVNREGRELNFRQLRVMQRAHPVREILERMQYLDGENLGLTDQQFPCYRE